MTNPPRLSVVASILATAAFGACAVDESPEAASLPVAGSQVHADLDQLAKLTSHTGTTVELYTAGSGFLFVEYGPKELPRAIANVEGLSLADVYRTAAHAEPPADLVALSAQIEALPRNPRPDPARRIAESPPSQQPVPYATGSCSATWMQNQGFCSPGSGTDWNLLNWWNGAYEHLSGVFHSNAWLCADIGNIVWEIHNGDGGNHTWTVLEGQLFNYGLSSNDLFGTWLNYDVTHATNNRFQFCGWASP
jgi:hypothetical protein